MLKRKPKQEQTFEDKLVRLVARLTDDHKAMVAELAVQLHKLERGEAA